MTEEIVKFVKKHSGSRHKEIYANFRGLGWGHGTVEHHMKKAKSQLFKTWDREGKIRYYPMDANIPLQSPQRVELMDAQRRIHVGSIYSIVPSNGYYGSVY